MACFKSLLICAVNHLIAQVLSYTRNLLSCGNNVLATRAVCLGFVKAVLPR
jgi:hypothetical protein